MTSEQAPAGMVRVAIDAMGGDNAPAAMVQGALEAIAGGGIVALLVGDQTALEQQVAHLDLSKLPIKIIPSDGVIKEGENPVSALREKPKASISVATQLVKLGHADAAVTMGSTGAAMAVSMFALGTLEGVERPSLGGPIFSIAPKTVVIDLGTNVDCRPAQLLSFGVIGSVLANKLFDVENPRVALLSVGAEEGKGNRQVKEAYDLLKQSGLNFIGNIEGFDVVAGNAEVVVCDGFVGNILMKFSEGMGVVLEGHLSEEAAADVAREIRSLTNVVEGAGGGPLLGVDGAVIVGHGRAQATEVAKAIRMAKYVVDIGFVASLKEELKRVHERVSA
jgi:glycerol-3-phosphate acyltransferase PlsX